MVDCSNCNSSLTEVIESRLCSNSTRRRRHCCLNCGYRWTSWDGPRPEPGKHATVRRRQTVHRPDRLTDDQVRLILERRDLSAKGLAKELGRTRQAICQIRRGDTYRDVLPEVPRWDNSNLQVVSCHNCIHWRNRCGMDFPDPIEEGPGFAVDCSFYKPTT